MKNLKNTYLLSLLLSFCFLMTSCLETDEFDGLTDSLADKYLEFPDREFDQRVGFGIIADGTFNDAAPIQMNMTAVGGTIATINQVQTKAGRDVVGTCGDWNDLVTDVIDVNSASFTFSTMWSDNAPLSCTGAIGVNDPGHYYELRFNVTYQDGTNFWTEPIRVLVL